MPALPTKPPTTPDWSLERQHWVRGYFRVAGVDEAGRGAWAGPVTVAAVILPNAAGQSFPFADSKTLSSTRRTELAEEVRRVAVSWAVEHAWPEEIERLNVLGATHTAALRAVAALQPEAQALVTDYLRLRTPLPLLAPPKADALSLSVAAASIIAKTERDALMTQLDEEYAGYGFAAHKGYGAPQHREALERLGVSEVHRRGFKPVALTLQRRVLE